MPAETALTARQQEIWQFLVTYVDDHGYPPTVREIGEEVGLASPSTVHAHLANLERVGLIKRDPTKPRAIELTGHRRVEAPGSESDVPRLPLLGRVAAGSPLLAEENVEDVVAVPESIGRGADFLLTIHGDSMVDAGILDGDTIVVQRRDDALERRRRGRARRRRRDGRRGDGQDLLSRGRRARSGCSRRTRRSSRSTRTTSRILGKVVGVFRSLR